VTTRHLPKITIERPTFWRPTNHATPDGKTSWWKIARNAADAAEPDVTRGAVWIMDEIGYWGRTAAELVQELDQLDVQALDVHINSPGGEVFDGLAIYNALLAHQADVTVHVDGLAASIASVIAQAGDVINIAPSAQMMIHDASGGQWGTAGDMLDMADILDRMSNQIAAVYAARAGGRTKDWREAMLRESWYTGPEAVDAGLATSVIKTERRPQISTESATSNSTRITITVKPDDPPAVPTTPPGDETTAADVQPETEPVDVGLDGDDVTAGLMSAFMPPPDDPWELEPLDFRAVLQSVVNDAPVPQEVPQPPSTLNRIRVEDLANALLEGLQV
jgi:ATP-dependent protease ClpP protease subunit